MIALFIYANKIKRLLILFYLFTYKIHRDIIILIGQLTVSSPCFRIEIKQDLTYVANIEDRNSTKKE